MSDLITIDLYFVLWFNIDENDWNFRQVKRGVSPYTENTPLV